MPLVDNSICRALHVFYDKVVGQLRSGPNGRHKDGVEPLLLHFPVDPGLLLGEVRERAGGSRGLEANRNYRLSNQSH